MRVYFCAWAQRCQRAACWRLLSSSTEWPGLASGAFLCCTPHSPGKSVISYLTSRKQWCGGTARLGLRVLNPTDVSVAGAVSSARTLWLEECVLDHWWRCWVEWPTSLRDSRRSAELGGFLGFSEEMLYKYFLCAINREFLNISRVNYHLGVYTNPLNTCLIS